MYLKNFQLLRQFVDLSSIYLDLFPIQTPGFHYATEHIAVWIEILPVTAEIQHRKHTQFGFLFVNRSYTFGSLDEAEKALFELIYAEPFIIWRSDDAKLLTTITAPNSNRAYEIWEASIGGKQAREDMNCLIEVISLNLIKQQINKEGLI